MSQPGDEPEEAATLTEAQLLNAQQMGVAMFRCAQLQRLEAASLLGAAAPGPVPIDGPSLPEPASGLTVPQGFYREEWQWLKILIQMVRMGKD